MSQTAADANTDVDAASEADAAAATDADEPAIEEDLFEEELRIDGICGVY